MNQATVNITNTGFSPQTVTVSAGDIIFWVNQTSTVQDANSNDGGQTFTTGPVQPGQSSLPITFLAPNPGIAYSSTTGFNGTVVVSGGPAT